ncbi:hypothetical protein Tco_0015583 [Tanacetum coccineum]
MDDEFLATGLPKVTSTPPVIAPFIDVSSIKSSSLVSPPPINTEAITITLFAHSILKSLLTASQRLQLRIKKSVTIRLKTISRSHDSDDDEDDDDDEGPSAGSNQGRSAKRRRPESAASGSSLYMGWKITGPRDDCVDLFQKKRFLDSFKEAQIVFKTLTPAEQEAADIMKASRKQEKSKRHLNGKLNEGTGNILGVPDESTAISRASSEGTGSKPGVPNKEKLIL